MIGGDNKYFILFHLFFLMIEGCFCDGFHMMFNGKFIVKDDSKV